MAENENGDLSQESMKLVEAGKAAHQAVVDLAETRRLKIEEQANELKLINLEVDRLRIDVHDMKIRMADLIKENQKSDAARVAYETFVILLARQITEFVPPSPPEYVHRREEEKPAGNGSHPGAM
jgi:hypothetical protein